MNRIIQAMVVALTLSGLHGTAQLPPGTGADVLRIRSVEAEALKTPVYDVRASGINNTEAKREWLRIQSEFDTASEWMDEVTFTYYVLLKARRREDVAPATTPYNVFKGTVTYVNVPKGNKIQSAMFLDPWSFQRFGSVEKAAVQVSYRGSIIAEESSPADRERWWERAPAHSVPLINRGETPFREVNSDSYPTIKPAAIRAN